MFRRLKLIREVGGRISSFCTWVVLVGTIAFSGLEPLLFKHIYCFLIACTVTIAGWICRRQIMKLGPNYFFYSNAILFIYGLFFFGAKHFGFGHHAQWIVIATATVIMFNLNFWSISEAAIVDQQQLAKQH